MCIIIYFQIANSGVELSNVSMEMMSEFTEDGKLKNPPNTAKRRKMDSVLKSQFEMESKKLLEWFERTETTLELLTKDEDGATSSPNDQFTAEEQLVLVQVRSSININQVFSRNIFTFCWFKGIHYRSSVDWQSFLLPLSDHVWVKSYRDVRCVLIGGSWVYFQDTENEVEERKSEVHKVLSTGRRVMTELNFGKLLTILANCKLFL